MGNENNSKFARSVRARRSMLGLPQASARRICGRGPHPHSGRGGKHHKAAPCRGRVSPVCRFQEGGRVNHTGGADFRR